MSERGKNLTLVGTDKYRFIRQRKDGQVKWLCTNRTCYASILLDSGRSKVLSMLGEHRHILNTMEKIEHQILRENCKRKADDSISSRPSKIIRSELMATDFEVPHSDTKSIRKAIYHKRRKNYPPFPDSLTCAILQLRKMEENGGIKFKQEKFVHAPDDLQFICITTKANINVLLQCEDVFVDGTFEYAPKYFMQLYTIHGLKNGYYLPLVYFFLIDKCKETYIQMWTYLIELSSKYSSELLNIKQLHVDFEVAAHEAAKTVFPDIKIIGCRFHFGQAWWRKVST